MGVGVRVKVWGDYALFSRPEMKVERCSYDVMTPSAARGLSLIHISMSSSSAQRQAMICGRDHTATGAAASI